MSHDCQCQRALFDLSLPVMSLFQLMLKSLTDSHNVLLLDVLINLCDVSSKRCLITTI